MANVEDVARANLLAAEKECVGEVINIGGGTSISVNALIGHLERITGKQAKIRYTGPVTGDARHTMADIRKAKQVLRWEPQVELVEGLERTVASMMEYYYPEVR